MAEVSVYCDGVSVVCVAAGAVGGSASIVELTTIASAEVVPNSRVDELVNMNPVSEIPVNSAEEEDSRPGNPRSVKTCNIGVDVRLVASTHATGVDGIGAALKVERESEWVNERSVDNEG